MKESLARDIERLPNEQALEAVNLLAWDVLGATPDAEVLASVAAASGLSADDAGQRFRAASGPDVAALCHLTLIAAADDNPEAVAAAIERVGEKALLLEIAIIATIACGILHQIQTGGRKREVREVTITEEEDGRVSIKRREEVEYYSTGSILTPIVSKLLPGPGPGAKG